MKRARSVRRTRRPKATSRKLDTKIRSIAKRVILKNVGTRLQHTTLNTDAPDPSGVTQDVLYFQAIDEDLKGGDGAPNLKEYRMTGVRLNFAIMNSCSCDPRRTFEARVMLVERLTTDEFGSGFIDTRDGTVDFNTDTLKLLKTKEAINSKRYKVWWSAVYSLGSQQDTVKPPVVHVKKYVPLRNRLQDDTGVGLGADSKRLYFVWFIEPNVWDDVGNEWRTVDNVTMIYRNDLYYYTAN